MNVWKPHIKASENIKDIKNLYVNFFFGAKHFNNGKIDSHLYFFRGFCNYLDPQYCLLFDIGTEAKEQSINKLVRLMDIKPDIGGACGDMDVDLSINEEGKNVLTYAQYYEYKLSHFIDKAFEGCFNYQSVLPGAYSILRWQAVKGRPIDEFLHGLNKTDLDLWRLNMFLAEDRIMCFEIVSQQI